MNKAFVVVLWLSFSLSFTCVIVVEQTGDSTDIVSKAFTSVEQDHDNVQYVTMTPEEAAAAGVMEEEQV